MTNADALRVQLLGQVRVWRGPTELQLGSAQQRAVLALLALGAGRPVSAESIINALWGDNRPASAGNVLQTYIKRLRRVLEPNRLPRAASVVLPAVADGYCLRVDPLAVDLLRARHSIGLAAEARQRNDHACVRELLADVVDRLTVPPMADVPMLAAGREASAVENDRWIAVGWYADAAIALGATRELLPILQQAVAALPFDEVFHARLLTAYRLAGRRAEGITLYHGIRRRLVADLGVEPGPELSAAYQGLIDGPADLVAPFQLPPRVGFFSGRDQELRELDSGDDQIQLRVVSGLGGVGKTALALEWAYRARDQFPDGQLYLNLRGNDPSASLSASAILMHVLRSIGLPREACQVDEAGLVALYRTLVTSNRFLIVLDDAADPAQVEPLVPPSRSSQLILTSRQRFTGLATRFAVREVVLDVLSVSDAFLLLQRTVGAQRLATEPEQAQRMVALCGRFPLALRIVAAQLASRKRQALVDVVRDLSDDRMRLARFAIEDGSLSVRAAFASTYRSLSAEAALVFRALGTCRLVTFTAASAVAAAGLAATDVDAALNELHSAHLINEVAGDRYTWHDLIQLFAQECSVAGDFAAHRDDAANRLLDWYLSVISVAGGRLAAFSYDVDTPPLRAEWSLPFGPDLVDAIDFLDHERPNLIGIVRCAMDHGRPDVAWKLCQLLFGYFVEGHGADGVQLGHLGLQAATAVNDRSVMGFMHGFIGRSQLSEGHHVEGLRHLEQALDLHTSHSDLRAQAIACKDLGVGNVQLRRFTEAVRFYQRSAELFGELGEARQVTALTNNIADAYNYMGEPSTARRHLEQVMVLLREHPDERNESVALTTWGEAYLPEDEAAAIDYFERALSLHRRLGSRRLEAETLSHIAQALSRRGQHAEALRRLVESVGIQRELGNRHGESVAHQQIAEVHAACGRWDEARESLHEALRIRQYVPYPYLEAQIHGALADIAAAAGRGADEGHHRREAQRLLLRLEGGSGG